MNGAGRWRCSLDWMSVHIVMTTSPIIHGHLRQGIEGKRMSTFSFRYLVYGYRICGSIFKSCLPTQMTTPSDDTNFTLSMNLFCRYIVLTFFMGTHERFAWICSDL
jgi:hypothetical protein